MDYSEHRVREVLRALSKEDQKELGLDSLQISQIEFNDIIDRILSLYARIDELQKLPTAEKNKIENILELCSKEQLFDRLRDQPDINKAMLNRLLQLKQKYENDSPLKR